MSTRLLARCVTAALKITQSPTDEALGDRDVSAGCSPDSRRPRPQFSAERSSAAERAAARTSRETTARIEQ
jgi:hypothetical protein